MHRSRLPACPILAAALLTPALLGSAPAPASPPWPTGINEEESKVPTYPLPDPLVTSNGHRVNTAAEWPSRRAELFELFQSQVYGRVPTPPAAVTWDILSTQTNALDGLATRREIRLWITGRREGPSAELLLYTPNRRPGPAPAFVGLNFDGNHAVTTEPDVRLSTRWMDGRPEDGITNHRATEAARGTEASRWPLRLILERGYAVGTAYYGDFFPDHRDGRPDSLLPHLPGAAANPQPESTGAIGTWAFGLSRILDFLVQDPAIDRNRIAVLGHSRLGKTALWAGAQDQRFALVISNDSGEGGAALSRRWFGETVERINTAFPHWFCPNYHRYGTNVPALPVDQHELIALIAPRPVYIASAAEDRWADPRGEFLAGQAASPVYVLLGTDGLAADAMPPVGQPVFSRIGYHIRPGKHDVTTYDWEQFLAFADRQLGRPSRSP